MLGQARRLFEAVIEEGDKEGEGRVGLGYLHSRGLGVSHDPAKAMRTLLLSAVHDVHVHCSGLS